MVVTALLLFTAGVINSKPAPVYAEVSIGASGPYRFLVDTGSQTSLIDPALAKELQLKPEFRVEIVTPLSTRLLPGLNAKTLSIGANKLPPVELVFHELDQAKRLDSSVRGVLGMNALTGLSFNLTPASGRMELGPDRPAGEVVPFTMVEERIAVKAQMGAETLTLILDSGSSHVVLFHVPEAMAKTKPVSHVFGTLEGARTVVPTTWTADMLFETLKVGTQPAAIVKREGSQAQGLLPASIFRKVHVDSARRELVLVR